MLQTGAMTTSAKAANLVEVDGIEPLGATLLNNAYRVTAGNREQPAKFVTHSPLCVLTLVRRAKENVCIKKH